jgi:CDP-diacylglycerol pyrophosphatase
MRFRIAVLAAFALLCGASGARAEDPDALWKIVNGRCVPDQQQHGLPAPCMQVQIENGVDHGFTLLKDRDGKTQILLIPTARITGIESPALLAPDATDYLAQAWLARTRIDAFLQHPLPRDFASLAINAISGRSQEQLHIHIDCIDAAVRATLTAHAAAFGPQWSPIQLDGHTYLARSLTGDNLDQNLFHLLADTVPGAKNDMGHQTLVVVGASLPGGQNGFILLTTHTDLLAGNRASGEELQDHACKGV